MVFVRFGQRSQFKSPVGPVIADGKTPEGGIESPVRPGVPEIGFGSGPVSKGPLRLFDPLTPSDAEDQDHCEGAMGRWYHSGDGAEVLRSDVCVAVREWWHIKRFLLCATAS